MKTNLTAIARDVKKIYFDTDLAMKSVPKVCRPGCSHCCHQNIRIHFGEGPAIERYIRDDLDPTTRSAAKLNLATWLDYFDRTTPNGRPLTDIDILVFERQVTKDRIPCPFLIDQQCAIYRARPLVCRTHSINDTAAACAADAHRNGDPAGIAIQVRKVEEISKAADALGIRLLAYAVQEVLGLHHPCKPIQLQMAPTLRPAT